LAERHCFDVVLTGAAFEREVNEEFIQAFNERIHALAHPPLHTPRLLNAAGTGSLLDLSGLITCCELFLSTDSGPYHMAVALKVSTLVWFVIDQPASYHGVSWCERVVNPGVPEVLQAVDRLIG
jgi:ADP-heptose:LPS heptosyltransferase